MKTLYLFFGIVLYLSLFLNVYLYCKKENNNKLLVKLVLFVFSVIITLFVFEFGILRSEFVASKFGNLKYEKLNQQIVLKANQEAEKNPYGFRVNVGDKQKDNGIKRIIVMGDSFVWGDGLEIEDIWSRKLARIIKNSGSRTEVIDFGKNAWATLDQFNFLRDEGIEYNPDLIIWGYVTNDPDFRDNPRFLLTDKIAAGFDFGLPFVHFFPESRWFLTKRLEASLYKTKWFKDYGYGPWEDRLYKENNLKNYSKLINKIALFLNNRGIPFFFVSLPNSPSEHFSQKFSLIEQIMEENQVPFLDLYPKIKEKFGHIPTRDWKFKLAANPANGHPGKNVTKVYAEEVF